MKKVSKFYKNISYKITKKKFYLKNKNGYDQTLFSFYIDALLLCLVISTLAFIFFVYSTNSIAWGTALSIAFLILSFIIAFGLKEKSYEKRKSDKLKEMGVEYIINDIKNSAGNSYSLNYIKLLNKTEQIVDIGIIPHGLSVVLESSKRIKIYIKNNDEALSNTELETIVKNACLEEYDHLLISQIKPFTKENIELAKRSDNITVNLVNIETFAEWMIKLGLGPDEVILNKMINDRINKSSDDISSLKARVFSKNKLKIYFFLAVLFYLLGLFSTTLFAYTYYSLALGLIILWYIIKRKTKKQHKENKIPWL